MTTQGFTGGSVTQKLIDVNSPNVKLKYDIIMDSVITEKTNQTSRYLTKTEYGSFDDLESKIKEKMTIRHIDQTAEYLHDQKKIESIKTVSKQIRDVLNFITFNMYYHRDFHIKYDVPKDEIDYINNLESNGIKITSSDIDVEKRYGFSTSNNLMGMINNYLKNSEEILKKESEKLQKLSQTQPEDTNDFRKTLHKLIGITVNFSLGGDDDFHIVCVVQSEATS